MVSKKLSETVKKFYLSGRLDEDFVMDAVRYTLGGEVNRGSTKEDVEDHIDFWWNSPRKGKIGIDVKGVKKNSRNDNTCDDTIHWLELKNVQGKDGWLYGKAVYIAFRTFSDILFVKRDRLLSFALECIKNKAIVNYNPNECYTPYRRKDRDDLIIKVKTSDLRNIADFCIDCN
jgi:hypothetical protein